MFWLFVLWWHYLLELKWKLLTVNKKDHVSINWVNFSCLVACDGRLDWFSMCVCLNSCEWWPSDPASPWIPGVFHRRVTAHAHLPWHGHAEPRPSGHLALLQPHAPPLWYHRRHHVLVFMIVLWSAGSLNISVCALLCQSHRANRTWALRWFTTRPVAGLRFAREPTWDPSGRRHRWTWTLSRWVKSISRLVEEVVQSRTVWWSALCTEVTVRSELGMNLLVLFYFSSLRGMQQSPASKTPARDSSSGALTSTWERARRSFR